MNPFMGAPTHPLLGAADNYAFPMTNGLLGSMGGPNWTQVALNLAGNPHAGPYANAHGLAPLTGAAGLQAGSSSGGGGGSTVAGLLGALSKNPSLIKDAGNAIGGLFGGGLGGAAAADAAAGDAAIGSTVAPELAAENASIAAGNSAALGGSAGSAAGSAGSAASSAGSSGLLGTLGAIAPVAAWFASYENTNPVNESAAWWNDMTNRLNSSDPSVANLARLTTANDYLNGGGDTPYTAQQLAQFGINPQYLADISRPITTPSPTGRGWLGGGFTGQSRA